MPDPNTANIDPFFEEPTLILTCDVVEPGDGKPYERDPRSLAKRAEAYMKASRPGRRRLLRPGARVLRLRQRALEHRHVGLLRQDRVRRSRLEHRQGVRGRQHRATARRSRAATSRCRRSTAFQDMRSEMCLILESLGIPVEVHHHEVANAGQMEIGTKFSTLVQRADWLQLQKYVIHNVAHAYGKTATFMPKPIVGDNGSRHARAPVGLEGRQEPVRRRRLRRPVASSRCTTSAASSSTPAR